MGLLDKLGEVRARQQEKEQEERGRKNRNSKRGRFIFP